MYENRQEKFTALDLKAKIEQRWEEIELENLRKFISQWKKRLRLVCDESGCNIQHISYKYHDIDAFDCCSDLFFICQKFNFRARCLNIERE